MWTTAIADGQPYSLDGALTKTDFNTMNYRNKNGKAECENREYVNCEDEHLFAVIGFELSSRNFGSLYSVNPSTLTNINAIG